MVERASALEGHNAPRRFGLIPPSGPGIRLSERPVLGIWLAAAWPDRLAETGAAAAAAAGADAAPGPGQSATGRRGTLLRIEPLKWLLISEDDIPTPSLAEADGTVLELGHARTVIHVSGPSAADLMARLVPLDLRPGTFPEGSVASTRMHQMGVTILARDGGYDLFCLRSFGLAAWTLIGEVAAQFGAEVV
ncbi:MAG: sarcosine oxidase subunit gamma [Ectothiorhodospiraceae bacterium]|nr:sarcosine oxidase subunit gamma [Ectothiorhodospiraceae bacterium]